MSFWSRLRLLFALCESNLFCFFSFHCLSLTLGAFLEGLSAYPFYKGAEIAFRRDFL